MPSDPFVSRAQQQKWQDLVTSGKKTQSEYDARQAASPSNLPQKVGKPHQPSESQYTRALKKQAY